MSERHEIRLTGCSPAPLSNYLKGLGILRVVSVIDAKANAAWVGEDLHLTSQLTEGELGEYLLEKYAPTPVLSPWNGGSGFYEKDNQDSINKIRQSKTDRFENYRDSLRVADSCFEYERLGRKSKPEGKDKDNLISRLRSLLPDAALDWLDASIVLSGGKPKFPPLLGSGGNDGRLEFSNHFMQNLLLLIDPANGKAKVQSAEWLQLALFGEPASGLTSRDERRIGQFSPGQIGGPNSTTDCEPECRINLWDFVLMIEGVLAFAAATVRRNEQSNHSLVSYPFTVETTPAGSGTLGRADSSPSYSRGEMWMPLWRNPTSWPEVRALLSEGRMTLGRRTARNGLDFVRAVHRFGGYRGIDRFQRYGILKRSGKAYLATPLDRVQVTTHAQPKWIDDINHNGWLDQFRRFSRKKTTANRFSSLCQQLENRLFVLAQRPPTAAETQSLAAETQSLIVLFGEIQYALSRSTKAQQAVPPIPQLSEQWMQAADDGSATFRIARSLARLKGVEDQPLPIRSQLFPIHHIRRNEWLDKARKIKSIKNDPALVIRLQLDSQRDLVSMLIELLRMRLSLPARLKFDDDDKPLSSYTGIDLADLTAFLSDTRMDTQIAALLPGLSLCKYKMPLGASQIAGDGKVYSAFALCKLAVTPNQTLRSLGLLSSQDRLPVPARLLSKLASGNAKQTKQAIEIAWRRLRHSDIKPVMPSNQLPEMAGLDPRRLAAALLIPLNFGATRALAQAVLQNDPDLILDAA